MTGRVVEIQEWRAKDKDRKNPKAVETTRENSDEIRHYSGRGRTEELETLAQGQGAGGGRALHQRPLCSIFNAGRKPTHVFVDETAEKTRSQQKEGLD